MLHGGKIPPTLANKIGLVMFDSREMLLCNSTTERQSSL